MASINSSSYHSAFLVFLMNVKFELQSNLVITNSTGPSVCVRYNRDIVITVKVYVVNTSTHNIIVVIGGRNTNLHHKDKTPSVTAELEVMY